MPNDSQTDLATLEYEFATNPNSEAFVPLAQAYLKMGRFVEAMVVCKKGIKAHPELPTGRLIMARIYSDQAKHQKAIDELNNLLKTSPQHAEALRLLGKIHLKTGHEEEGVNYLRQSLEAEPDNEEAKQELLKRGIEYRPPAPEPPPPPAPPPAPERPTQPAVMAPGQPAGSDTSDRPTERAMPAAAPQAASQPAAQVRAPGQPQAPVVSQPPRQQKRIADLYQEMERPAAQPKNKFKNLLITVGIAGVVLLIYVIYTWQAGLVQQEINNHLVEGKKGFIEDTYIGYKQALEHYRAILKIDKNNPQALARAAFICSVLVGEHGEGRELLAEAEKDLRQAMADNQNSTLLLQARGLYALYGGGSKPDAIKELEKGLKDNPNNTGLHAMLGVLLLDKGDLSEAKEHLVQGARSADIRALRSLGQYALRRSMYREAMQAYNRALQSNKDHATAVLMTALISILTGGEDAYAVAADKQVKRFKAELEKNASSKEKALASLIESSIKMRFPAGRRSAMNEIEALLKKEGANPMFLFVAAREYRYIKNYKKAQELIQKALRMDSSRPDFVLEEAAIFLGMKDFEAARARALRVQRMDAESGRSMLLVGDAYKGENNIQKAKQYYEKARGFEDTEALSHFRLGQLYLTPPNVDKDLAQAELELAVQSLSGLGERRKAARAAVMVARIYAEKNRTSEYVQILQKAQNIDQTYALPYLMIAKALDLSNPDSRKAAVENCQNYLKLEPNNAAGAFCKELVK